MKPLLSVLACSLLLTGCIQARPGDHSQWLEQPHFVTIYKVHF